MGEAENRLMERAGGGYGMLQPFHLAVCAELCVTTVTSAPSSPSGRVVFECGC